MPATSVKRSPDSNVTLEAASSRRYFEACRSHHIYIALGVVAILVVVRLVIARLRDSRDSPLAYPWTRTYHQLETEKSRKAKDPSLFDDKAVAWSWSTNSNPNTAGTGLGTGLGTGTGAGAGAGPNCPYFSPDQHGTEFGFSNPPLKPGLTAGFWLPSPAVQQTVQTGLIGSSWHPLAMDGDVSHQRKDHSGSAPATATSRGVSTNTSSAADIRRQLNPSLGSSLSLGGMRSGSGSGSNADRRTTSRSSHPSSSRTSSSRRHSGSANGADSSGSKGKGEGKGKEKEPMTTQGTWFHGAQSTAPEENPDPPRPSQSGDDLAWLGYGLGSTQNVDYTTSSSWHFSRPPPPPPLTTPAFSDSMFPFENRHPGYAVSIPPELDGSFIHQANPDYGSGSTSEDPLSFSPQSTGTNATGIPRRRSYTRSVPVGIPIPATTSASSSTETITSPAAFSPSSFPPRAPLLPPPPPGSDFPYEYQFVGGPGGPGILDSYEEVDLHGNLHDEILSAVDDTGHGWTRHTRVYGGGVCLACIAAGGEGGFYGDKVPLEDRR